MAICKSQGNRLNSITAKSTDLDHVGESPICRNKAHGEQQMRREREDLWIKHPNAVGYPSHGCTHQFLCARDAVIGAGRLRSEK